MNSRFDFQIPRILQNLKADDRFVLPKKAIKKYGEVLGHVVTHPILPYQIVCISASSKKPFLQDFNLLLESPDEITALDHPSGLISVVFRKERKALGFLVDAYSVSGQNFIQKWIKNGTVQIAHAAISEDEEDAEVIFHDDLPHPGWLKAYCRDDYPQPSKTEENFRLTLCGLELYAMHNIPGLLLVTVR